MDKIILLPSIVLLSTLSIFQIGCGNEEDVKDGDTDEQTDTDTDPEEDPEDTGESTDTGVEPEEEPEEPSVGNPPGELIAIDHSTSHQTMVDNMTDHIDGLESALKFLEDSQVVENFFGLFSDQDEDAGTCSELMYTEQWDCENSGTCSNPNSYDQWSCEDSQQCSLENQYSQDDCENAGGTWDFGTWSSPYVWTEIELETEPVEIDLSELRDGVIETISEELMLEDSAVVSDDGLSITYTLDPNVVCIETDIEEDESPEDMEERLEDEQDCLEMFEGKIVQIATSSDMEGDVNLTIKMGSDGAEPQPMIDLQVHDDQISIHMEMPKMKDMMEFFIDPDDFEFPDTMEGEMGIEIRKDANKVYTARFVVLEDINIESSAGQDPMSLQLQKAVAPGHITFNGTEETISGVLDIASVDAILPWQFMVDLIHDDEEECEWICEWDNTTQMDNCYEICESAPDPVDVGDKKMIFSNPGVMGTLFYSLATDSFDLTNMGMGGESTTLSVDEDTILTIDINPEQDRVLDMRFHAPDDKDLGFVFSQDFGLQMMFAWDSVRDDFIDGLPDFLLEDVLGIQFAGASPELQIVNVLEDTQIKMAQGSLTVSSPIMPQDLVVEEGECFVGVDTDDMTEEEQDALHDLFGEIDGGICEDE
jgi:hypothetical protein